MNQQSIGEEIRYLKAVASMGGRPARQDGALLLSCGLVWGLVALIGWFYLRQPFPVSRAAAQIALYLSLPLIVAATLVLRGGANPAAGPTSRGMSAAWLAVVIAVMAAVVMLIAAAIRLRQPQIIWLSGPVTYVLFGAGWTASAMIFSRQRHAVIAAGCFLMAIVSGALIGSPELWLLHGLGLLLLVALPGAGLLRENGGIWP